MPHRDVDLRLAQRHSIPRPRDSADNSVGSSSLDFRIPLGERSLIAAATLLVSATLTACLDRPVGRSQPRTTNVLSDELVVNAIDKIDLLFVIDNSMSMADKQKLLASAVPDLVQGLVDPNCIGQGGTNLGRPSGPDCPEGSHREFDPVSDIHVGVITSSLGGYGSGGDCVASDLPHSEEGVDMAHLLGSLPRGAEVAPSAAQTGFLTWNENTDARTFFDELRGLVTEAGERGCGWEAPLEAWVRFLVDPHPYTKMVRSPCSATDTGKGCIGPELAPSGDMLVDSTLLAQRRAFLRPDSLVAVVMLSDENDCSFKARGQTWLLSESITAERKGRAAFRPTAACDDPAYGPDSECCHSCGLETPPAQCPNTMNDDGELVGVGCEENRKYEYGTEEDPNLRCYDQKRRFGIDMLYPTTRYSNALKSLTLCPYADDLDPTSDRCPGGAGVVPNPLYEDLSVDSNGPDALPKPRRPSNLVFLAGIVGVPWQDLAVSPDASVPLVYRQSVSQEDSEEPPLQWDWLIGPPKPSGGREQPADPLMIETTQVRSGVNPATGQALAPPDSTPRSNTINGHEWEIGIQGDLQYACTFPLSEPTLCKTNDELNHLGDAALEIPACDCTKYGGEAFKNPLCQQPDGSYGLRQTHAKAYPSSRQLQTLHDVGDNSIVASICPKSTDLAAVDYGYRPAMAAIVNRLKVELGNKCYSRELSQKPDGSIACRIVEALPPEEAASSSCETVARKPIEDRLAESVRRRLLNGHYCETEAECEQFTLCEITQLLASEDPDGLTSCLQDEVAVGDGWCYIDEARNLGNPELLGRCPDTARRTVRYAGAGRPANGSVTVVSCAGKSFD